MQRCFQKATGNQIKGNSLEEILEFSRIFETIFFNIWTKRWLQIFRITSLPRAVYRLFLNHSNLPDWIPSFHQKAGYNEVRGGSLTESKCRPANSKTVKAIKITGGKPTVRWYQVGWEFNVSAYVFTGGKRHEYKWTEICENWETESYVNL